VCSEALTPAVRVLGKSGGKLELFSQLASALGGYHLELQETADEIHYCPPPSDLVDSNNRGHGKRIFQFFPFIFKKHFFAFFLSIFTLFKKLNDFIFIPVLIFI
jgi:hypothetical protein